MKFWGKDNVRKRKLRLRVGGESAYVIVTRERNELDVLDMEFQRIEDVLHCIIKNEKSINRFDEKGISISLKCPVCIGKNKEFCQAVINLIGQELTSKMSLPTKVDTAGFISYNK